MAIRILIADDHGVVRQGLRMFLGVTGEFEVVGEAENGQEAVQKALELRPDVVLMDLLMPVMDGWEFARSLAPGARPPIIVLSADRNVSVKAKEIGALGWLAKPFELSELLAAVRGAVPVETP